LFIVKLFCGVSKFTVEEAEKVKGRGLKDIAD